MKLPNKMKFPRTLEILTLRLIATVCFCLFVWPGNNFYPLDFVVFTFCACYLQLIDAPITHLDLLYFCFVDQDSAHDRGSVRCPDKRRKKV